MTRLGAFCVAVALSVAPVAGLWPGPAVAQDSTPTSQQQAEDKSSLETWLQEQFSGTGRKVEVQGFSGALGAQAQVAKITVADDTGVWLEISDIVLDWSRSAFRGGAAGLCSGTSDLLWSVFWSVFRSVSDLSSGAHRLYSAGVGLLSVVVG